MFHPPAVPPHDYRWLLWTLGRSLMGDLTPATRARLERTRRRFSSRWPRTRLIDLDWREDVSVQVRFIGHQPRLGRAWRRTATLTFNDRPVFVEAFGGLGYGPVWGFTDVRLHLDGRLEGRAWKGGCAYGGGGPVPPAVAFIRPGVALAIGLDDRQLALQVAPRSRRA